MNSCSAKGEYIVSAAIKSVLHGGFGASDAIRASNSGDHAPEMKRSVVLVDCRKDSNAETSSGVISSSSSSVKLDDGAWDTAHVRSRLGSVTCWRTVGL